MQTDTTTLANALRAWLDRPQAVVDVDAYFAEPHQVDAPNQLYSGRCFERLGGGGDHPDCCDRFIATDLLAVQMLSVVVPPETTIEILHGTLGRTLSRMLHQIPTDVAIDDQNARAHLEEGSPADQLWRLLVAETGAGWVTAGKLLARKRPHLVPVYDGVVKCAAGEPPSWWLALHAVLADPHAKVRERLTELRTQARVPAEISLARLLDVVLWMGHRRDHRRDGCPYPGSSRLGEPAWNSACELGRTAGGVPASSGWR